MVSTEDTVEIWEAAREEAIEKVRGRANRSARADSPMADEAEVEKSFCSADQFSKVEIQEKFLLDSESLKIWTVLESIIHSWTYLSIEMPSG